jgi:mycothiol synthase
VNAQVVGKLDAAQQASIAALLARCREADGHEALAEPQQAATAKADLGGHGTRMVLATEGDELVACAVLTPAADGSTSVHVAVDPGRRAGGGAAAARSVLVTTALSVTKSPVRLWTMRASDEDDAEVAQFGFVPERDVVQMRIALPLPPAVMDATRPLVTRAFVPGRDDEAWLSINNRAFAGHPEQGAWTADDLHERMQAPWFDPDGFLVADAPDRHGLIGSCWTKVHRHTHPPLGEIYVISVDPDRHGQGWGRSLTVAGLQWLAAHEVSTGMLYTDASNTAAMALYRSMGFTVDHRDRSYLLPTPPPNLRPA